MNPSPHKYNFTTWLIAELQWGRGAFITYIPFLPLVVGFLKPGFDQFITSIDLKDEHVFHVSIIAQIITIFVIIVYQSYVFIHTEKNGLRKKIDRLIEVSYGGPVRLNQVVFEFTHTNNGSKDFYWNNFRSDYDRAIKNIFFFKFAWLSLWVFWFCDYVAIYAGSDSHALFSAFQLMETLCMAACYFLLTRQIFEKPKETVSHFWWAWVILALLLALAIVDQTVTDLGFKLFVSAIKTIITCTFLGLLVGTLTKRVQHSPHWVRIVLFFYVALQPLLFAAFDLPDYVRNDFQTKYNYKEERRVSDVSDVDSTRRKYLLFTQAELNLSKELKMNLNFKMEQVNKVLKRLDEAFQVMEILMFNFSLVLKYVLMFYIIWLLRFDHLLVYYLRSQGDKDFLDSQREAFEKEI